ncbi:MAG TPA: permease prefix domain 2-containing transporter [Herpetosiphonaceae bacterium]
MRKLVKVCRQHSLLLLSIIQMVSGMTMYIYLGPDVGAGLMVLTGMAVFLMNLSDLVLVKSNSAQPKHINRAVGLIDDKRPPKFAEYLLRFVPKQKREYVLGDLEEEYREIYDRNGKKHANVWYWWQVVRSFWPYIISTIKKVVGWGIVGWVGDWIRRLVQ